MSTSRIHKKCLSSGFLISREVALKILFICPSFEVLSLTHVLKRKDNSCLRFFKCCFPSHGSDRCLGLVFVQVTAGDDSKIRIWDLKMPRTCLGELPGHAHW